MALRTISICAGVGALDLGIRIARSDAVAVAYVEREASAAASLVANMAAGRLHQAPVWDDLATFDAGAWRGAVDCVVSGDPCQGNSVAGKRLGELDERWLLDRAIEVFDQCGASTFFRENVTGNAVGQLAVAVPALERLGCRVAVGIFSAAEVGASHKRERLFILAHRSHLGHEWAGKAWRRGSGPADDGGTVDDAKCPERRAISQSRDDEGANCETGRRIESPDWTGASGQLLVDPQSIRRREGWPEHAREQGRSAAASASGQLAYSYGIGRRSEGDQGLTPDDARQCRCRMGNAHGPDVQRGGAPQ